MRVKQSRGFSLIEILVVIVVIGVLAAFVLPGYLKGGKTPGGKPIESPIQRGHSVECMNNLNQIRQAYQITTAADEENKPQTLDEFTRSIPASMKGCPVGGQPYQFDAATGRVACVQPGHERH
ncbi:MAG TPA: prepilin-type N-terminal cleavage/methylation domain-containing protein [Armatimonadota bacterium]|nr:prepilin-type N-terminal cleavage/methylation domain-containing protein [Armatimonadota bacterium]